MSNPGVIQEGGLGGHMDHLYDNPSLSFGEMKEIFQAAAAGQLERAHLRAARNPHGPPLEVGRGDQGEGGPRGQPEAGGRATAARAAAVEHVASWWAGCKLLFSVVRA